MSRARLLAALLCGGALLIVVLQILGAQARPYAGATSFSNRGGGLGIFADLAQQVRGAEFRRERRALLGSQQLEGVGTFLTFSPKSPFSSREAGLLKEFVDRGGHLVVGIESSAALSSLSAILKAFAKDYQSLPLNRDFRNQETRVISLAEDSQGFLKGLGDVNVYGRYELESGGVGGFIDDSRVGKGTLTLIAGLSPVGNALIGRGGNPALASRLLSPRGEVVLDEHHHLFAERSVWDLVGEPSFALPIGGMIVLVIIFSLFGRIGVTDAWKEGDSGKVPQSFHAFGLQLFSDMVMRSRSRSAVTDQHAEFLLRLFPREGERISAIVQEPRGDWIEKGRQLTHLHGMLMKERGRRA